MHGFTLIGLVVRLVQSRPLSISMLPVEIIELGKFPLIRFASWQNGKFTQFIHGLSMSIFSLRWCVMPYRKCTRHDELEFSWMVGCCYEFINNTWRHDSTLSTHEERISTDRFSLNSQMSAFWCEPLLFVHTWRISNVMNDWNLVSKLNSRANKKTKSIFFLIDESSGSSCSRCILAAPNSLK